MPFSIAHLGDSITSLLKNHVIIATKARLAKSILNTLIPRAIVPIREQHGMGFRTHEKAQGF